MLIRHRCHEAKDVGSESQHMDRRSRSQRVHLYHVWLLGLYKAYQGHLLAVDRPCGAGAFVVGGATRREGAVVADLARLGDDGAIAEGKSLLVAFLSLADVSNLI